LLLIFWVEYQYAAKVVIKDKIWNAMLLERRYTFAEFNKTLWVTEPGSFVNHFALVVDEEQGRITTHSITLPEC
jgi:hypothetical protein